MKQIIAIAAGGALGALMRFWAANGVYHVLGRNFPYGTLVVNVLGSLLMGIMYVVLFERLQLDAIWRALILVGFLGAFTTFSTFSIETLALVEDGELLKAFLNITASVVFCLIACWMGLLIGRTV